MRDGEIQRLEAEVAGAVYRGELTISSSILSPGLPKIDIKGGINVIRESSLADSIKAASNLVSEISRVQSGQVVFDPLNLPAVSGAARSASTDAGEGFYMVAESRARIRSAFWHKRRLSTTCRSLLGSSKSASVPGP